MTLALTLAVGSLTAATPTDRASITRRARADLDAAGAALLAGRLDQAAALFIGVRETAASLGTPNLPLARAVDGLADVRRLQGEFDTAAALYAEALRLWEPLLGADQPRLATTLHNLGLVDTERGRPTAARRHLRRALAIWETTVGADSPQAIHTRRALTRLEAGP